MTVRGRKRKLPWQKWFWTDYDSDKALLPCSWAAQGMWPRKLAVMWEATPRGHFLIEIDGVWRPPTVEEFAAITGKPPETIPPLMAELERYGVFSRTGEGVAYNRRMDADAQAYAAEQAPTETEREVADRAVQAHLRQASKDEERRAKDRARQARHRARKRAGKTSAQACEHLVDDLGETLTRDSVTPVTEGRDSHVTRVTCHVSKSDLDHTLVSITPRSLEAQKLRRYNQRGDFDEGAQGAHSSPVTGGVRTEAPSDPRLAELAAIRRRAEEGRE